MIKIIIAILCYFSSQAPFAQTNPIGSQHDAEARRVITLFIQSEFDGVLDVRADLAKFNAEKHCLFFKQISTCVEIFL
jgi:hypothetical protein